MKPSLKFAVLSAFSAFALIAASPAATTVVGSGPDVSYFVVEAPEFGEPLKYEYHYTFDASAPIDSYTLMTAADAADANLRLEFINYGSDDEPNYILDSVTYNSVTLLNDTPFWAQWVSGGKAGFPTASEIAGGAWTEGDGLSLPYRELAPGSWDGFIHNGTYNPDPPLQSDFQPPSTAPVAASTPSPTPGPSPSPPPVASIPPTVRIIGRTNRTISTPAFTVTGTASAGAGLSAVQVRVGGGPFRRANGSTQWRLRIRVEPGKNRVRVRAIDLAGAVSPLRTFIINRR